MFREIGFDIACRDASTSAHGSGELELRERTSRTFFKIGDATNRQETRT
jgi:hypothetical protein